jgi:iron complex outermembrane receptor protein
MKFQRKQVALACMVATGAIASVALDVQAQAPAPQGTMRVEVTGTNIRRVDAETASPVQVLTAEDLQASGYTSLQDVLRDVPSNGQGMLSQGFNGAFAGGASGIALRGLNVGNTLVLIDGLRMAPYPLPDDGQKAFVNIASIPFSAVERVEILLDGASAIYGSDAIGGVVNIILRKNFKGFQAIAEGGQTFQGDGTNYYVSAMAGWGTSADKFSGLVSFEYRQQDNITFNSRSGEDWASMNFSGQGGNDIRPGATSPVQRNPVTLAPYLQRPGGNTQAAADNIFLNNQCDFNRRQANQCVYDNTWNNIQPETKNYNLLGNFNWRINDNWTANLAASWFYAESQTVARPIQVPVGSYTGAVAYGPGQPPTIKDVIGVYQVPANYPGNTFGVPANVRAVVPDIGASTGHYDSNTYRVVGDLKGSWLGWDWDLAAGYTYVSLDQSYTGGLNPGALLAALRNPTNPFKLTGGNSGEVLGQVSPEVSKNKTSELNFIQLTSTRDLMKLEGGPLGLALGASYVYQKLNADNFDECKTGLVIGQNCFYSVGSQSNSAFFAEINAPVLKTLELGAAVRYDYYNTYGGDWTPKVSAKWTPIPQLALRGTWGQGFRAPYISENGSAGFGFTAGSLRDPLLCPVLNANGSPNLTSPQNVPAFCNFTPTYQQSVNKDLEPEKSTNWTVGFVWEPIKNLNLSADYYSIELKNQIIAVGNFTSFDALAFAVRGPIASVTYGDGRQGPSTVGPIAYINDLYVNANKTTTTGLDLSAGYTWKLPDSSTLRLGAIWSHIFTWDLEFEGKTYELAGTHGPALLSGNTGNPQDRVQLSAQWVKNNWTTTLTGNYVGSYNMLDPSAGNLTCLDGVNYANPFRYLGQTTIPDQFCEVDSFWYWNLSVQWQATKQLSFKLAVTNLFDQQAPVDMGTYSGTGPNRNSSRGAPYNPSLHWTGIQGASWLLGVQYNF